MKTTGSLRPSFAFNVARLIQIFPAMPLALLPYLLALEILHVLKFE